MPNGKVGNEHFDQAVVAFLFTTVDKQVLKFLQFFDVTGELNYCNDGD